MEIGRRLIHGGSYAKDFFENNPPMLFYIHGGLVKLSETLKLSSLSVFYSFITLSTILSYISCYFLSKRFLSKDKASYYILNLSLVICFCFIANLSFGQKEHLMLLFSMPYFFNHIGLQLNKKISPLKNTFIGFFAGIGFALKPPFFFIGPFLVELYLIIQKKKITTLFRWDLALICLVQLLYLVSIFIFTPTYITTVFPYAFKFYMPSQFASVYILFTSAAILYFFLICLSWIFCYQKNQLNQIAFIFFWGALGFALSFLLQRKGWNYHTMPLFMLSTLFFGLVNLSGIRKYKALIVERYLLLLCSFLIFIVFAASIICLTILRQYRSVWSKQSPFLPFIKQISSVAPKQNFLIFSNLMLSSYISYYGELTLGSRYPTLWLLPALLNPGPHQNSPKLADFIRMTLIEDLKRFNPKIILVNRNETSYIKVKNFDYLSFMKKNKEFSEIWQQYRKVKTINMGPMYQYDIYLRHQN